MNLYEYLKSKPCNMAQEAKEAYERFRAHGRTLVPQQDCDPFVFAFVSRGYQAFTFKPDQIVRSKTSGNLAIVTGWTVAFASWHVLAKTAKGEFSFDAGDLEPAEFPEGLVEILRGKVHDKDDEAFA